MTQDVSIKELSADIRTAIEQLKHVPTVERVGIVTRVGDGVAWIYGLSDCGLSEMIEIEATDGSKATAFALNLMEDEIGAVLLGGDIKIKAGAKVRLTGKLLEV